MITTKQDIQQEQDLLTKLMDQEGSNLFLRYLSFEYNGHWITDIWTDETGRFEVNPLKHYGEYYLQALKNKLS